MPLDVGRVSHLIEQMHRSEDDAGDPIAINKVLVTDGARGFTWEDYGGGSSACFSPDDYGAVHDGTTDDTGAIQDAIDAAVAAGGGDICFSEGIYQIDGALTNTSTFNSQLNIPNVAFGGEPVAIRFRGTGPNTTYGGTTPTGTILRSSWNGTISGNPAILSAGLWHGTGANWSNVMVSFEDLVIIAHDDPKLTALQMSCATNVRIENVQIRTTSAVPSAYPTHTNAVGYEGVWGYASTVPDWVNGLDVYGFYFGMRPAEQTNGGELGFAYCTQAIAFIGSQGSPDFTSWPNYFTKIVSNANKYGLVFSNDLRWVNIGLFAVQRNTGTFATTFDISDPDDLAHGFISYHAVDLVAVEINAITVDGGANLSFHSAHDKYWKLNSVVEIPTGTDPSTNPDTGFRLYAASANGKPTSRDSSGTVTTIMREGDTAGGDLSGTYPNPSVANDSHSHTAATLPASTGGIGEILISDTHSTPLVFGDLLQNEDQDDLVYADP